MHKEKLLSELQFQASRSSGAGGQHVNKVSSKIELRFNIANSSALSEDEKNLLLDKLHYKLNKNNELILTCQESRSQHKNKEIVVSKLFGLLKKSLYIAKKRKPTKPNKQAIKKRLEKKAKQALKKENRKKIRL